MQTDSKKKSIIIVGHSHIETIAPLLYNKHLPKIAKKFPTSFLDEMNERTLELCIFSNISAIARTPKEFKRNYQKALNNNVINSDSFYINRVMQNFNYNFTLHRQALMKRYQAFSNLPFVDIPDFYEKLCISLQNCDADFLKDYMGKFSQNTYDLLKEIKEVQYSEQYNLLIKNLKNNDDIDYTFIDFEDIRSKSIQERDDEMYRNTIRYIMKNPERQLIIISVGRRHIDGIQCLLEGYFRDNRDVQILSCDISDIERESYVKVNPTAKDIYYSITPRTEIQQAKDEGSLLAVFDKATIFLQPTQQLTIQNLTNEKFQKWFIEAKAHNVAFKIISRDENQNTILALNPELLNVDLMNILEINRCKVEFKQSTAKEQLKALKNLRVVTIESEGDGQALLTYPISIQETVQQIVMNFEKYQIEKDSSFVKFNEEMQTTVQQIEK